MSKRILIISIFLLILSPGHILGQGGNCPKIKVGVKISEVYPEVFNHLNKDYSADKHSAVWLSELGEKLMESLRNNSPEIEFIYLSGSPGADYDYLFTTLILLMGGGADIEVLPEHTIIEGDNAIKVPPVYKSEYIDYYVLSSLIVNSNCKPNRRYILKIEKAQDRDIYQALASNVAQFWRLVNIIEDREDLRPVPPREPAVTTRLDKEYISLLTEESRKIKIYENVKSCNGKPSYFQGNHSQPVRFPEKTDRGEIKPTENCKLESSNGETQYILVNESGDAVGEYTIQRGLEPLSEKITLSTCPLGNKPNIEKEVEIVIRGLKLEVEPDRKTIHNGEQTSIQIDLHELDPDGTEILSCAGKEVDVKVTGLVDGTISHKSGKITLNEVGVAFIDYKAGKQDKQIKISATFTPPGYPEEVKGEATINVKPMEYEATLTIKGSYTNTQYSSYSKEDENGTQRGNSDLKEIQAASFYIPLRMERADDVPMLNQRWEYYSPVNINLTTSTLTYRHKKYDYASYKTNHGFEQTVTRNKNPVRQEISGKETLEGQMNIILVIDKETSKVVKIITGGYGLDFYWKEDYKIIGYSWDEDGKKPINKSESKTDDISSQFVAGPVEDEVPDPIAKSVAESLRTYLKNLGTPLPADIEIPEDEGDKAEIRPDLLVEFGDGKTSFGGDGKRILDNSKGSSVNRQEWTFNWQVTRRKK